MLMDEYFYYKAHQEAIIKNHLGDYVVIKGNRILGYYEKMMEAFRDMAQKNEEPGTYAVRKCKPVGEPDMAVTDIDYQVVSAWTH
jgi:hypothetical protein